jgi:FtsH-binding integral membrane protein
MGYFKNKNSETLNTYQKENTNLAGSFSLVKIFGYMFIGLLISAVVAFILGAIFGHFLVLDPENTANTLFIVMVVSSIVTLILAIVIPFMLRKANVIYLIVPMVLYAITIGIMLSSFTIFVDWWLLAGAFLITTLIFGLMSLISFFAKKMNGVLLVGIALILGSSLISLFNIIMMFVFPEAFQTIYWIISLAVFAGMMLITMYDIFRIKQIAMSGNMSTNLSLYCAFTLYVDFIYIFMRVLLIILQSKK